MTRSPLWKLAKQLRRLPALLRAYFKDQLTIQYDGLKVNYSTRSSIAKSWFYPRYISGNRLHEPPISFLIKSELDSQSTFFDIGANVGFFTVLAARLCNSPEGEVHAFELDPTLIPLIKESLLLNESHGRVFLNYVACADEIGHFHPFQAVQGGNPSTNQIVLSADENYITSMQAMTTTIDHYCDQTGVSPDLIKMDIEGAEALAVSGMINIIKEDKPKIILEVHPDLICDFGKDPIQIVKLIQDSGSYENIWKVKSYRENVDNENDVLSPLDMCILEKNDPVVLFFNG